MEGLELQHLDLRRCPHCGVARPFLQRRWHAEATMKQYPEFWALFQCSECQKYVLAMSLMVPESLPTIWPPLNAVDENIPQRAGDYLLQAIESIHAPAGAVMLAASAVDAMLKEKGYREGSLYSRIDKAKENHLITQEMAAWAHEIRLDANDQRHADENAALPTESDTKKSIAFAQALAQFLFVLPAQVERGRGTSAKT